MKTFPKSFFILFLIFSLTATSCQENFFDQVPDDRLTEENMFEKQTDAERVLYRVYSFMNIAEDFDVWGTSPWLGLSDEADMTWKRDEWPTWKMNVGVWDAGSNNHFSKWRDFYRGIRIATYFLRRIDENKTLPRDLIPQYKAEARFLRAYYYFCLLRQYGPTLLLGDTMIESDTELEQLQMARSPFDVCVDYVVKELDLAAQDLPLTIDDANFLGKATKGAALSVKARMLLYAASPLFNGNPDYASFTNKDGVPLMSASVSKDKWKLAADAAKAVIDLNAYSLYKKLDASGKLDPYLTYQNLFLDDWNNEVIWARFSANYNAGTGFARLAAPRQVTASNGIAATQQIVDAYHMANGKLIDDPESGYVEQDFSKVAGKYTKVGVWNMYCNREPRFYASISYNGGPWVNPKTQYGDFKIEYFFKGKDGKAGSYNYPESGYCIRKFLDPNQDDVKKVYPKHTLILFRLAEMYLNYAEALNEHSPGHPDIAKYMNLIRERAGLALLAEGLSQTEMRKRIWAERRVELAFEAHRFFDTRRWKIAEQTDGGPFSGMNMNAGESLTDPSFYQRTVYETRIFTKKNYLFPIPQKETEKDLQLVQNPGW